MPTSSGASVKGMEWLAACALRPQSGTQQPLYHQMAQRMPTTALWEALQVAHACMDASAALAVVSAMCTRGLLRYESLVAPALWPVPEACGVLYDTDAVALGIAVRSHSEVMDYTKRLLDLLMAHRVPHSRPFLEDDIQEARRVRHGLLWTALRRRAQRRLSAFAAAVLAVCLWRRWQAYMCEPESGYVQRRVLPRLAGASTLPRGCPRLGTALETTNSWPETNERSVW